MKARFRFVRRTAVATAALFAIITSIASVSVVSRASDSRDGNGVPPEHWGIITRNTIGSPVADLRFGPYGSFGVTGPSARPPFGVGSLGIEVANDATTLVPKSEKVDFGNEVDFFGDPVLALNEVGFHVFQTGENASAQYGGPMNMPNIRFEIDANLTNLACAADNYTTMVWVPDPVPVSSLNRWSGYIDATTNGKWYFTGAEEGCTLCTQALNCNFTQAMAALNDGPPEPIFYTVAVGKGRDNIWVGAVDGFRLNDKVYDFEFTGVRELSVNGGDGNENADEDDDLYDWGNHHGDDDDD
jgi:hypothetical protein